MKVIGFYTNDAYRKEYKRLKKSLDRFNIDYYIQHIPYEGDWNRSVAVKPIFVKGCRNMFRGGLLYVDVDAVFHEDCSEYFDNLDCDFAAHWFQGPKGGYRKDKNDNHFLSGTMYFADSRNARLLLYAWIHRNKMKQEEGNWQGGGQANLKEILDGEWVVDLEIVRLPGRYCYVFDKGFGYPEDEPKIIEHLIASRENRDKSKGKINKARQERIKELDEVLK